MFNIIIFKLMEKNIKTISWKDSGAIFLKEARKVWSNVCKSAPAEFITFIQAMSAVSSDILSFWLDNVVNSYHLQDFTESVTQDEDACLFKTNSESPVLLSIVTDYLLYYTQPAEWCYVDEEKKAIAHFVKRNDGVYYAELYCLGKENSSYLHFKAKGYHKILIPVNFMEGLPLVLKNKCSKKVLRDYLPREIGSLLSKRSHCCSPNKQVSQPRFIDRGDRDTL